MACHLRVYLASHKEQSATHNLPSGVRPFGPSFGMAHSNDIFHRRTKKTSITRVIRTTRRERQEEVPLVSFDSFPPVERDLKYSRERERLREKIFTKVRPTGLKNRRNNSHKSLVRQEAAAAGRFDRQVPFGAMHSSGARWHAVPSSGGLIEEKPARGQIGSIGIWENARRDLCCASDRSVELSVPALSRLHR